jgi:hypothetical protein
MVRFDRLFIPAAAAFFVVSALFTGAGYARTETVGVVKTVSGAVYIERWQQKIPVAVGTRLQQHDTLVTGADGAVGVIFKDNSILSVGADTRVDIDSFVFQPRAGMLSFILNIKKGVITSIPGQIAKLKKDGMTIKTPTSACGVRGTYFGVRVE